MHQQHYAKPEGVYLLSHSVGLLPQQAQAHMQEKFFTPWAAGNENIWHHWIDAINDFRAQLGLLFNSDSANFCPQTNLSGAVTKFVQSRPMLPGKSTILLSEEDFPSIGFALQKAAVNDCQLKFIPADADTLDLNVWDEQLTADVGLVLVTHVQSNNGKQLPVSGILRLARERNIGTLVDVAQSAGIMQIDFQQWQADAIIGSCVKWICGGPGAAYLWINPTITDQCQPLDVGWFSHENPFEFDIHNFRYASDALRFWGGTPSVMPFVVAAGSLEILNARSVEQTRKHNLSLSQKIIDAVDPKCLLSPIAEDQRGGTIILSFGQRQDQVIDRLRGNHIQFDIRGDGIRVSPHIYNSVEEMDLVISSCLMN